jgi:hypothetical protein
VLSFRAGGDNVVHDLPTIDTSHSPRCPAVRVTCACYTLPALPFAADVSDIDDSGCFVGFETRVQVAENVRTRISPARVHIRYIGVGHSDRCGKLPDRPPALQ